MKEVCNHLEIPYMERMFAWKKYPSDFQGHSEWNEQKIGNHIHHWHGRAIDSEKIGKPKTYETNKSNEPTFSKIANEDHREKMKRVYRENLIFYNKFIEAKEDHLKTNSF